MLANQSHVTHEQSRRRPRTERRQLRLAIMSSDALLAGIPEDIVDQMYLDDNYAAMIYKAANSSPVPSSRAAIGQRHVRKNAVVWEDIMEQVRYITQGTQPSSSAQLHLPLEIFHTYSSEHNLV